MCPTELSPHSVHDFLFSKSLRSAETMQQSLVAPASAVMLGQLCCQCFQHLLAVFCTLVEKDILFDALANMPIGKAHFGVDIYRHAVTHAIYYVAYIKEKSSYIVSVFVIRTLFNIV